MRRRNLFVRKRAELLSHIQNTTSQYNLESLGTISRPHHRRDKAIDSWFPDPVLQLMIDTDIKLIDHYDPIIKELDRRILALAKGHDPQSLALLCSIHGVGQVLALTMLYPNLAIEPKLLLAHNGLRLSMVHYGFFDWFLGLGAAGGLVNFLDLPGRCRGLAYLNALGFGG